MTGAASPSPWALHAPARRTWACVALLLAWELAAGATVAAPWASAAGALARGPHGDRDLLGDPSGVALLELGRLVLPGVRERGPWLAFVTVGLLGLAPLSLLFASVVPGPRVLARGVALLPRMLLLFGAATLAQAAAGVVLFLGGQRVAGALEPGPWADRVSVLVLAAVALAALALGVVADVVRAASARGHGLYDSFELALGAVAARPAAFAAAFGWRGAAGLFLAATAAAVARDLARGPDAALVPAFLVGQLGVLASLALRADWLRFASASLGARGG